jgi:hypothetical protein
MSALQREIIPCDIVGLTCSNTKIPPKTKARAFAPFLTKTPAHTPQTVPNVSSYMLTMDSGGGGRAIGSDGSNVTFERDCEEGALVVPVLSQDLKLGGMIDLRSQPNLWRFA